MSLSTIGAGSSNLALFSHATGIATCGNTIVEGKVPEKGPSTPGLSGSVRTDQPTQLTHPKAKMLQELHALASLQNLPFDSAEEAKFRTLGIIAGAVEPNIEPTEGVGPEPIGPKAKELTELGFRNLGEPPKDFMENMPIGLFLFARDFANSPVEKQIQTMMNSLIRSFYQKEDGSIIPNFSELKLDHDPEKMTNMFSDALHGILRVEGTE
ncbi:MAG: hypothetical protein LBT98_00070 [Puniceicoccales bacterium]|nr:hypothetical protein [Puniceicoccales bacterium]